MKIQLTAQDLGISKQIHNLLFSNLEFEVEGNYAKVTFIEEDPKNLARNMLIQKHAMEKHATDLQSALGGKIKEVGWYYSKPDGGQHISTREVERPIRCEALSGMFAYN